MSQKSIRRAAPAEFWLVKGDNLELVLDYVKSDFDLAKDYGNQGHGDHRCCGDAYKHTNHENRLFHP